MEDTNGNQFLNNTREEFRDNGEQLQDVRRETRAVRCTNHQALRVSSSTLGTLQRCDCEVRCGRKTEVGAVKEFLVDEQEVE